MPESTSILVEQIVFSAIATLLILVTGGVVYLTWTDWRDRRRRKLVEPLGQPRSKSKGKNKRKKK
ncbi:MAG: hypothetical protein AAF704_03345 [Cyanobacteria bacterium P01_D01_bin.123]